MVLAKSSNERRCCASYRQGPREIRGHPHRVMGASFAIGGAGPALSLCARAGRLRHWQRGTRM